MDKVDGDESSLLEKIDVLKKKNESLLQKNQDLELLHAMSNAVHESSDLQHIYNTALDMASTLKDVDMAFIYMISEDRKEAILQAHRGLTQDYLDRASVVPYGRGTTWKVLSSGEVYNMEDIQADKSIAPAGRALGHRRSLGIPIMLEGVVMGVIFLASKQKGKFSEREIELNVAIGKQVGIAIAKAKLYAQLETSLSERTQELEITKRRLNELVDATKNILQDEQGLASYLAGKPETKHDSPLHKSLSEREYNTMIMIAKGMKIKDIASSMYVSTSAVNTFRIRILEKLDLSSSADIIRYAIKNNLTD